MKVGKGKGVRGERKNTFYSGINSEVWGQIEQ